VLGVNVKPPGPPGPPSARSSAPSVPVALVRRLHVDLCRLASRLCPAATSRRWTFRAARPVPLCERRAWAVHREWTPSPPPTDAIRPEPGCTVPARGAAQGGGGLGAHRRAERRTARRHHASAGRSGTAGRTMKG